MMRVIGAIVVLLALLQPLTRPLPTASAHPAKHAFVYHAQYLGKPVVLTYSGQRHVDGATILQGTLIALGQHYGVEADYFYGVSTPDLYNRVYGQDGLTRSAGGHVGTMVGEFTLSDTCNPDCADSTTYVVHITMRAPAARFPLPNGLILTH